MVEEDGTAAASAYPLGWSVLQWDLTKASVQAVIR